MRTLLDLLTWLGDSRLLLPVMIGMGVLWFRRRPRVAVEWVVGIGGVGTLVAVSKILHKLWGVDWRTVKFYGISGHSAMATVLFPILFYALAAQRHPRRAVPAALAGGLLAVTVAVSRVVMDRHTPSEIIAGCLLGVAVDAMLIARWRGQLALPWPPVALAWLLALALVWLLPGVEVEHLLQRMVHWLRS